ncbi:cellulose biosynthesis protein BcsD [Caulobacter soli]|uniref:cellulose biosynthesis protein BcsD n=1 Tax=Caulobacter soli TaxID=2708539 RepID=UPI0013EBC5E5|nr:cellulose biosynthesis protein BcsD [Caulobacter soli]
MKKQTPSPDDLDLDHLRRRQVSRQWASFLAAMAQELKSVADETGSAAFMRATGARVARLHPLAAVQTLEELQGEINAALGAMDWGWSQLTAVGDHIVITHGACPNVLEHDSGRAWPPLMAEVLAGAYGAWLHEQGSPGGKTVCLDPQARPLVFEHRA